ncbi:fimbrial protein [Providencia heimbachae]|uniref:fimbrial protein n=1 Tax=Providencia heimbachae TaxID=333962 RepID=UPI0020C80D29|nr:fimbrial protein [Providencia heimbachae]
MNILNRKYQIALILLTLAFTQQVFAGNSLEMTAEIENSGECDISISPSSIEFKRRPIVSDFIANDAVDTQLLSLTYECKGYDSNVKPEIKVTGSVSNDANLFLSASSQGASGAGFMLKNGKITNLTGFYTTGNTLTDGDTLFLPAGENQGELPLTIGFMRQSGNQTITAGSVKASILLTVLMP